MVKSLFIEDENHDGSGSDFNPNGTATLDYPSGESGWPPPNLQRNLPGNTGIIGYAPSMATTPIANTPAASTQPAWLKAITDTAAQLGHTYAEIVGAQNGGTIAAQNAAMAVATPQPPATPTSNSNTLWVVVAIVVVVGLGWLVFKKK